jgi:hypothetical protein
MKPRKPKPNKVKFETQNETWHEVGGHVLRSFDDGHGVRKWWINGRRVTEERFMKALKPLYPAPLDPIDGLG